MPQGLHRLDESALASHQHLLHCKCPAAVPTPPGLLYFTPRNLYFSKFNLAVKVALQNTLALNTGNI